MVMASLEPIANEKNSWLSYVASLMLHTYVAYGCAMHLSAWLVFHWFRWIMPVLRISTSTPAGDWYLRHLELMTIIPALAVGYVNVSRFLPKMIRDFIREDRHSIATWAWVVPALVLLYRMLEYHPPLSVLYGSSISAVKYFFDIQKVMPTWENLHYGDLVRVWAQMSVTAPFYAGVAYSLGALSYKHGLLTTLFAFPKQDEPTIQQDA